MNFRVSFKNLPFIPQNDQIIYVEGRYDETMNRLIRNNHESLKEDFSRLGYEFIYLPLLCRSKEIKEKIRYYAPYLTSGIMESCEKDSSYILQFMEHPENKDRIPTGFIYRPRKEGDDLWIYKGFSVDSQAFVNRSFASTLIGIVCSETMPQIEGMILPDQRERFSMESSDRMCMASICKEVEEELEFYIKKQEDPQIEPDEVPQILAELQEKVRKLRLNGVSLLTIHELIDKGEPLSRMVITPDYRILLPDYNNIEIRMGDLPKALFFLFLRYPEGIALKSLPDYYTELMNIYRQFRPVMDEARMDVTITKVVNPLGNAINENLARIRRAFVEQFDERLARNYFITGERGGKYMIPLDRDMIEWQE